MADYLRWDAHNFLHSDAYFHPADFQAAEPPDVFTEDARPERSCAPDRAGHGAQVDSLRRQVLGIISSVLEDSDPASAGARNRLRQCLMHNADSPEQALLEHLTALHGMEMHGLAMHASEICGSALHTELKERTANGRGSPGGPPLPTTARQGR